MLWCVCFMSFRNYLYRPVSLQVCDGFVCVTDSQWVFFFMSEGYSEVSPLWFHIFVLAVDAGVLRQINIIFLIFRSFWSEEWRWCEVWVCFCLCRSTLPPPPSVSSCVVKFFLLCSPPPRVLCVAPKCSEILTSTVVLKKKKSFEDFSSCECFSFIAFFKTILYFKDVNVFLFHLNASPSIHPSICMHVGKKKTNVPRCCIGSTLSLFLSLVNF